MEKGLYFDSSIPQGYGVGSSGALVAAIYDKYATDKITVLKILLGKNCWSSNKFLPKWNPFFTVKVLDLDPLNSYLSLPILIHSKDNIESADIPSQRQRWKKAQYFYWTVVLTGETAPMVQYFHGEHEAGRLSKYVENSICKTYRRLCDRFLKGRCKISFL